MRVVVAGLGKSGRSAVRFCRRLGADVTVSDAGEGRKQEIQWLREEGVGYEFGGHSEAVFAAADLVLISPGVPHDLPVLAAARGRGVPVAGELALAPAHLRTPALAVTGTNGKTTVTTLIGGLLAAAGKKVFVGGNIGTPLTDYLAGPQEADWVVLEVSSFQLDTAGAFRPEIGVLLNITPDHLDRYDDMRAYGRSKMGLFRYQDGNQAMIVCADDPETGAWLKRLGVGYGGQRICFGHAAGADVRVAAGEIRMPPPWGESYDLAATALTAPPNDTNAAAAVTAARLAGCGPEAICRGLEAFAPLPHRMELVAERGGVRYVDDSKATNTGAVCQALAGLRHVILIAGGRGKGEDFTPLAAAAAGRVDHALLIGETRGELARVLEGVTTVRCCADLDEAVNRAAALAAPGITVLLSPACASFDMFSGYEERGARFAACVRRLDHGDDQGRAA